MLGLDRYRNVTEYKIIFISVYANNTVSYTWDRGVSANNVCDRVDKQLVTLTFHLEPTSWPPEIQKFINRTFLLT